MMGLFMFRDSFANIVMITFTALILIEILNVYTQVSKNDNFVNFVDPPSDVQNDVDAGSIGCGVFYFDSALARVLRSAVHRQHLHAEGMLHNDSQLAALLNNVLSHQHI